MKKPFVLILSLLISFQSCIKKEEKSQENTSGIPVLVDKSVEREFIPVLTYAGTAFANKEANLGTAIPGRVEKIYFNEGQRVKKGDLLVELSSELYLQALIENNILKKDYERVGRLRENGTVSEQDFDHLKAQYDASVAKTAMMKKNAEIRAPFEGVIVDHIVNEGENFFFSPSLKPGYSMTSGIIKLMQLDILNVEIDVNEKEISKIHLGQKAKICFDAYPQKIYDGKVVKIDPILSTLSRTAKVQIEMDNQKLTIKPGMYAKVNIELSITKAVFVPHEAIYRQAGTGNDFVFSIENNRAKKIAIKRVYNMNDLVAVEGLKSETIVVVAGKDKLNDGMKIVIKEK